MLLMAVDIGNTNVVIGFIDDGRIAGTYRITTKANHTSDEYGLMITQFLALSGYKPADVDDVIISSVVPKVMHSFRASIVKFLDIDPMIVGPGIKTGLNIRMDNPQNMGADCIVQGIAITLLVLASFFAGVYFDMGYINVADMIAGTADEEGVMMAFITLNMVEIFHCFNMRSRRASLFSMKKQNWWLWGAAGLALVLTLIVVEFEPLAMMFFGVPGLELQGSLTALGLAVLIIPIVEVQKAVMRRIEKED